MSFDLLDANALYEILARLDPQSVLKTCQTNNQFRNLCQNPHIFYRLMQLHYPDVPINKNPKKQYIDITEGKYTTYYPIIMFNKIFSLYSSSGNNSVVVEVPGTLDPNTEIWLTCTITREIFNYGRYKGTCSVHKTKEQALEAGYNDFVYNATKEIEVEMDLYDMSKNEIINKIHLYPSLNEKEEILERLLNPKIDENLPHYIEENNLTGHEDTVYFQVVKLKIPY